jgi:hypothetical protein
MLYLKVHDDFEIECPITRGPADFISLSLPLSPDWSVRHYCNNFGADRATGIYCAAMHLCGLSGAFVLLRTLSSFALIFHLSSVRCT